MLICRNKYLETGSFKMKLPIPSLSIKTIGSVELIVFRWLHCGKCIWSLFSLSKLLGLPINLSKAQWGGGGGNKTNGTYSSLFWTGVFVHYTFVRLCYDKVSVSGSVARGRELVRTWRDVESQWAGTLQPR